VVLGYPGPMAGPDQTDPMLGPRSSTEPLPETARGSTQPLPVRGSPEGDRRLWFVAAVLALVLAFVAGYLVGRGGSEGRETKAAGQETTESEKDQAGGGRRKACAKAVTVAQKALALQGRALANRAALAEATAAGDEELAALLNAELQTIGEDFDRVEARLDKLTARCGA
jgi:hypothetical protein